MLAGLLTFLYEGVQGRSPTFIPYPIFANFNFYVAELVR
jgi:hypothetical protein